MPAPPILKMKMKVVILGEGSVGKSSLLLCYTKNKFNENHKSTVQASFVTKTLKLEDCEIEMNIWDTAGQEKYHALGPIYYRGSHGVLVVFDITDQRSFDRVKMWMDELKAAIDNQVPIVIIGNKSDLERSRNVNRQEAEEYANSMNAGYLETSALENVGIVDAFEQLATEMSTVWRSDFEHSSQGPASGIGLSLSDSNSNLSKKKKCC